MVTALSFLASFNLRYGGSSTVGNASNCLYGHVPGIEHE